MMGQLLQNFSKLLIFLFIVSCSRSISDNDLLIGVDTLSNVEIEADIGNSPNNPKLRFNSVSGVWEFSNDGVVFEEITGGSGPTYPAFLWKSYLLGDVAVPIWVYPTSPNWAGATISYSSLGQGTGDGVFEVCSNANDTFIILTSAWQNTTSGGGILDYIQYATISPSTGSGTMSTLPVTGSGVITSAESGRDSRGCAISRNDKWFAITSRSTNASNSGFRVGVRNTGTQSITSVFSVSSTNQQGLDIEISPRGDALLQTNITSPFIRVATNDGTTWTSRTWTFPSFSGALGAAIAWEDEYIFIGAGVNIYKYSTTGFPTSPSITKLTPVGSISTGGSTTDGIQAGSAAFSKGAGYLAVSSNHVNSTSQTAGTWGVYKRSGDVFTYLGTPFSITRPRTVAWSPDTNYLAIGTANAGAGIHIAKRVGDTITLQHTYSLSSVCGTGSNLSIDGLKWSESGRFLLYGCRGITTTSGVVGKIYLPDTEPSIVGSPDIQYTYENLP